MMSSFRVVESSCLYMPRCSFVEGDWTESWLIADHQEHHDVLWERSGCSGYQLIWNADRTVNDADDIGAVRLRLPFVSIRSASAVFKLAPWEQWCAKSWI